MTATRLLPEIATASAWCQRWTDRRPAWQLADPADRFDAARYEVAPIAEAAAKAFILTHHYSATYPAASRRFGLFRAGQLVGVAVYGIPAQAKVLTTALPDLQPYVESLELSRLVLLQQEPGNSESWFVARCHRALLGQGVRGVVSFADPVPRVGADGRQLTPGHVGWIYQAGGARYTGRGTARTVTLLRDGSSLNERTKQKVRQQEQGHEYAERRLVDLGARPRQARQAPAVWLAEALAEVGAVQLRHGGNHRYVFVLGRTQRQRDLVRIGLAGQPYPKQADSVVAT